MNDLSHEESLHLKDHAQDEINWFSLGVKATNLARERNCPIYLSIGNTFSENSLRFHREVLRAREVINFLNENFVCIKIDSEEYPEIYRYYLQGVHLMNSQQNFIEEYPLNIFLLPDQRPFFAGSAFPALPTQKLPSFKILLEELHKVFTENSPLIENNASKLSEAMKGEMPPAPTVQYQGEFPPPPAIMNALKNLLNLEEGKLNQGPPAPHYTFITWGLEQVIEGVLGGELANYFIQSAENILCSSLYDQIRGGVHHGYLDNSGSGLRFEKRLLDQALFLKMLSRLQIVSPNALTYDSLLMTLDYLESEMMDESGLFFSSQSAESENTRGLYFIFTKEEILKVLEGQGEEWNKEKQELIFSFLDFDLKNEIFENHFALALNKKTKTNWSQKEGWDLIRKLRESLLVERRERIPPRTDKKILAHANALLLASLADVFQYSRLDIIKRSASDLLTKASGAFFAKFVGTQGLTEKNLVQSTIESHVCYLHFLIRLYEVSHTEEFKIKALQTTQYILDHFLKDGFFYSRSIHKETIGRNFPLPIPNLKQYPYDFEGLSPVCLFLGDLRRLMLLEKNQSWKDAYNLASEFYKNLTLRSPLNAPGGLLTFTYPSGIYRRLCVPRQWGKNPEFLFFQSNFLPRFILDYHDQQDNWKIFNDKGLEKEGSTWENFKELFAPRKKITTP